MSGGYCDAAIVLFEVVARGETAFGVGIGVSAFRKRCVEAKCCQAVFVESVCCYLE